MTLRRRFVLVLLVGLGLMPVFATSAFAYWVDIQASSDGGKTFSDTSPRIVSGTTVKIRWKSNLPPTSIAPSSACRISSAPTPPSNSWTGLSGTQLSGTISQQTTYTAQCTLGGATVSQDTILITVKPVTAAANQVAGSGVVVQNILHLHSDTLSGPTEAMSVVLKNLEQQELNRRLYRYDGHLAVGATTLLGFQLPAQAPIPANSTYTAPAITSSCQEWLGKGQSCEVKSAIFIGGGNVDGVELLRLPKGLVIGTQSKQIITGLRVLQGIDSSFGGRVGRVFGRILGDAAPRSEFVANAQAINLSLGSGFPNSRIACTTIDTPCDAPAPNATKYQLTAESQLGFHFVKWESAGPCNGRTAPTCEVTVADGLPQITAVFGADPGNIDVRIGGDGYGVVTSQGALSDPIDCGSDCRTTLSQGMVLNLLATPYSNSIVRWSGCTTSTATTCAVAVSGSAQVVGVTFDASESLMLGDVSGNGVVNEFDALLLLKHLAKLTTTNGSGYSQAAVTAFFDGRVFEDGKHHTWLTSAELTRADVDRSGRYSVSDANTILRYARGCHGQGTACRDGHPYDDIRLGTVGQGPFVAMSTEGMKFLVEPGKYTWRRPTGSVKSTGSASLVPIVDYCGLNCGWIVVSEKDASQLANPGYTANVEVTGAIYGDTLEGTYSSDANGTIDPYFRPDWEECSYSMTISGRAYPTTKCQVDMDDTLSNWGPGRVVYLVGSCAFPGSSLCNEQSAMTASSAMTATSEVVAAPPSLPDLLVGSGIYVPLIIKASTPVSFSGVAFNIGSAVSAPTTAVVKISKLVAGTWTSVTTLSAQPVSGLSKYAHAALEWPAWTAPDAGPFKFEFCVDPTNTIAEVSESNNCFTAEMRNESLTVTNLAPASGAISSDAETDQPDIAACTGTCTKSFTALSRVTLKPTPNNASTVFDGWLSGPPAPATTVADSRLCSSPAQYTSSAWATDRNPWTVLSCSGANDQVTLRASGASVISEVRFTAPRNPASVQEYKDVLRAMIRERYARYLYSVRAGTSLAPLPSPETVSWGDYFWLNENDLETAATALLSGASIPPNPITQYGRTRLVVGQISASMGDVLAAVLMSGSRATGITLELLDNRISWITDPAQLVPTTLVTLPISYATAADMKGSVVEGSADGVTWGSPFSTITILPATNGTWQSISVPAGSRFQFVRMRHPGGKLVVAEFAANGETIPSIGGVCGEFGAKDCPLILTQPTQIYGTFAKLGDVSGDGTITSTDALCILRLAVGSTECGPRSRADTNKDGKITASDALCALRAAVGLTALPCATGTSSLAITQTGEGYATASNISGGRIGEILSNANTLHSLFTVGRVTAPAGALPETVSLAFGAPAGVRIGSITGCDALAGTTCTVNVNAAKQVTVTTFVPRLTVVSPNGGETLTENTTQAVKWSQNYTPTSGVKLSLLRASDNYILGEMKACGTAAAASTPAGTFQFTWLVGRNSAGALLPLTAGGKYKIRASDCASSGVTDNSNAAFTYQR